MRWLTSTLQGEEVPGTGHTFEFVFAAVGEVQTGAHYKRRDGSRHEHFTLACQRRDAGTDVDGDPGHVLTVAFDLASRAPARMSSPASRAPSIISDAQHPDGPPMVMVILLVGGIGVLMAGGVVGGSCSGTTRRIGSRTTRSEPTGHSHLEGERCEMTARTGHRSGGPRPDVVVPPLDLSGLGRQRADACPMFFPARPRPAPARRFSRPSSPSSVGAARHLPRRPH
jgi:hypothetical protein